MALLDNMGKGLAPQQARPGPLPSERFDVNSTPHYTADVRCDKDRTYTRQKKWYSHGRTGRSGSDAPVN